MDKSIVRTFMTSSPHTIGMEQSLRVAEELMSAYQIRHLPVLSDGKLVGILSQRDLAIARSIPGVDPRQVTVEEAMTPEPFSISPDTSLEWIAMEMAQHKYGATVVIENKKVVGVFTTVDALRALQGLMAGARRRRKPAHAARRA